MLDSVGICFQGPWDNSTKATLTRSPWPERTVLSTWDGETVSASFEANTGTKLVLSKKLLLPGKGNVRNQKITTLRGLKRLRELGVEFAWKIRTDFEVTAIPEITSMLLENGGADKISFLDWVLHKGGYPMDFLQFGKIDHLIDLWAGVRTHSLMTRVTEQKVDKSFVRLFAHKNADGNAHKSMQFMASKFYEFPHADVIWHKRNLSLKRDWAQNPVFCQLSGYPRLDTIGSTRFTDMSSDC